MINPWCDGFPGALTVWTSVDRSQTVLTNVAGLLRSVVVLHAVVHRL